MPRTRISMRKTKDVLRMKWELGLSHRQVARSLSIGYGTVGSYLARARAAGLESWEEVEALSDEELEARLFPVAAAGAERPEPDWREVSQELRGNGVTLSLLRQEYKQRQPAARSASRFPRDRWLPEGRRRVAPDLGIRSDDLQAAQDRLADEAAIEGIPMQVGE